MIILIIIVLNSIFHKFIIYLDTINTIILYIIKYFIILTNFIINILLIFYLFILYINQMFI